MFIQDIRRELVRSKTVRQVNSKKTGLLTVHWNGPSTKRFKTDLAVFKNDADWHVNNNGWDGVSYHFGVGRDGHVYQLRDIEARLNHAGVKYANDQAISVQLTVGEGDPVSQAQFAGLLQLINHLNVQPRHVFGHRESPRSTACPGALIMRWIYDYRKQNSGHLVSLTTKYNANIRDEPSVLSHKVSSGKAGQRYSLIETLGLPVQGDCLWYNISGTSDYIHASAFGV